MSRQVTYHCDICRDEVAREQMFAVYFKSNKRGDFELFKWPNQKFDEGPGIHFCFTCCKTLLKALSQIAKTDGSIAHINKESSA